MTRAWTHVFLFGLLYTTWQISLGIAVYTLVARHLGAVS